MKSLLITSSKIVVSRNSYSETGYYIFHRVKGILPGCRKNTDLTFTPMNGYVWVKSLWSYNGVANIDPTEWAKLVADSPVVSDDLSPYPITPDMERIARADALAITTCPAITDHSHWHPSYTPKFDEMTYTR